MKYSNIIADPTIKDQKPKVPYNPQNHFTNPHFAEDFDNAKDQIRAVGRGEPGSMADQANDALDRLEEQKQQQADQTKSSG